MCCATKCFLIGILSSVAFFILSLIISFKIYPLVLQMGVEQAVVLDGCSQNFERFEKLPFPLTFKVYLFDILNHEDVLNGGIAQLEERGPYIYKEYREKNITNFNCSEDAITYTERTILEFDENASFPFTEDDEIVTINMPLIALLEQAEELNATVLFSSECLNFTFRHHEGIIIRIKVQELLFSGYEFCNSKGMPFSCIMMVPACSIAATKRNVDKLNNALQFSYFNYKIRSDNGIFKVKRGKKDISRLGEIYTWNGLTSNNLYGNATTCSRILGTDGSLFPPNLQKEQRLPIYTTDLCR